MARPSRRERIHEVTMTDATYRRGDADFDVRGLWDAIEAERRTRDITWRRVLEEMAVPGVRHPLSLSTIQNLRRLDTVTCQHALGMIGWLRRTPESFVPGLNRLDAPLPLGAPERLLRWDIPALASAVNAARQRRELTWAEVANELDCSLSQVAGLSRLRYGTTMRLAMRITRWLDRPAANFVIAVKP
jgi:hypothetical protein